MLLGSRVKVKPEKQNFCVPSLKQNTVPSFFPIPVFDTEKQQLRHT